jgi:diadenosine tetraphosphate (Ap4A) HIT family hydrolase
LPTCSFCETSSEEAWILSDSVVALPHHEPVTAFHILVAPRRHVPLFYDLDVEEQRRVWDAVQSIQERIRAALDVKSFHVGFAEGEPGGDGHVYIHVLPRSPAVTSLPPGVQWVYDGS